MSHGLGVKCIKIILDNAWAKFRDYQSTHIILNRNFTGDQKNLRLKTLSKL